MHNQVLNTEKPHKLLTVVCACIKDAGAKNVLLSMRRAPGIMGLDGKWELPGGKIEFGETPQTALVREIREELGIGIVPGRLLPYLHTNIWEYPNAWSHVVLAGYECELSDPSRNDLPKHARWVPPEDIEFDETLPGTKEFVSLAMDDDRFNKICIQFQSTTVSADSPREFTVTTQPTLFSRYGLVKYWGTVGNRLKMRIEEFDSPKQLDKEILETAKRRLSAGYCITAFHGPSRTYGPLLQLLEMAKRRNQLCIQ
jgi:8-oxo-dGTP diphosphatase